MTNPLRPPQPDHLAATTVRGFRTPVRGHAFAARPPGGTTSPGSAVRLTREADNPADPLAVAVWVTAPTPWRIGYLDRIVAARLAPHLDAGRTLTARLEGWVDAPGGWRRPLVAVGGTASGHAPNRADDRTGTPGVWGRPPGVVRRRVAR